MATKRDVSKRGPGFFAAATGRWSSQPQNELRQTEPRLVLVCGRPTVIRRRPTKAAA